MLRYFIAAVALALAGPAMAGGSPPSVASVTNWGVPIVFNFQAAREQGIIPGKTEVRVNVKNSPTNPTITYRDGRWESVALANAVAVQFKSGDPAYRTIINWQGR